MKNKTLREWLDFLVDCGKEVKIKSEGGITPRDKFSVEEAKKEYADWLDWIVMKIDYETWPTNPHMLIIRDPETDDGTPLRR